MAYGLQEEQHLSAKQIRERIIAAYSDGKHERSKTMNLPLSGLVFCLVTCDGLVLLFSREIQHEQLNPYQVNFLMAIGMAVTAVPALWIKQGSLTVPAIALPLGAPIGLLMALGSICFRARTVEASSGGGDRNFNKLCPVGHGAILGFPK